MHTVPWWAAGRARPQLSDEEQEALKVGVICRVRLLHPPPSSPRFGVSEASGLEGGAKGLVGRQGPALQQLSSVYVAKCQRSITCISMIAVAHGGRTDKPKCVQAAASARFFLRRCRCCVCCVLQPNDALFSVLPCCSAVPFTPVCSPARWSCRRSVPERRRGRRRAATTTPAAAGGKSTRGHAEATCSHHSLARPDGGRRGCGCGCAFAAHRG